MTSGAEHLISHAIDEYYPEKSTIHGLQVGWAHRIIENRFRDDIYHISDFFERIGISKVLDKVMQFSEKDFDSLIPYALKIRNRYTILNTISLVC